MGPPLYSDPVHLAGRLVFESKLLVFESKQNVQKVSGQTNCVGPPAGAGAPDEPDPANCASSLPDFDGASSLPDLHLKPGDSFLVKCCHRLLKGRRCRRNFIPGSRFCAQHGKHPSTQSKIAKKPVCQPVQPPTLTQKEIWAVKNYIEQLQITAHSNPLEEALMDAAKQHLRSL